MIRRPLALLLPLALVLAGCTDHPLPTAAPEASVFAQLPASPVVNSLADPGDGTCDDAECTLREAIAFASPGAEIVFGVTGTVTLRQGQLTIGKDLAIRGPGVGRLVISGNNASRVFEVGASSTVVLSDIGIVRGFTTLSGAGISNQGRLTLLRTTVANNTAVIAGGIGNGSAGTLTLVNSTVSDNGAAWWGGGIYNIGSMTLIQSTVSGNRAESEGGGIWNGGTMILQGMLIAINQGPLESLDLADKRAAAATYSLIGSAAGHTISHGVDGNLVGVDAGALQLGPLADNGGPTLTHALLPGSVAIDAIPFGSNGCGIGTDQRDLPRPQPSGGACDIGAFEVQPPTLTLSIDPNGTLTKKTGAATLSGTLTCSALATATVEVSLSQTQTKGKNTTTVIGSASIPVSCSGTTPWMAEITPASGKFAFGSADATASVVGANAPVQASRTVQLK